MKRTLVTVAIALIVGQSFAADQGAQQEQQGAKPAPQTQDSAPKDSAGKDGKTSKEKPRMKSISESWGPRQGDKAGFPRLGGLEK